MRIALVSCVKAKRATPTPARDLYTSTLFQGLRAYAIAHADQWFILSAEYGLLRPDEVVLPYERTLNRMRQPDRIRWAQRVQEQLVAVLPMGAEVILLAGARYREHITPFLRASGFSVSIPLEHLSIGKQLQRLKLETDRLVRSV
jgi:cytoplasmic iron level regulating protein YaaA (DUF328/UPF0246 family)